MCKQYNAKRYYQRRNYTCVHADRTALSKCNYTSVTNNFKQWCSRNMECRNDKYIGDWHDYIHIHASCRSVCGKRNNGYNYFIANNSNIHTDWTVMSKQYSTCITNHI